MAATHIPPPFLSKTAASHTHFGSEMAVHSDRMPSHVVTWESLVPLYQVWICCWRMPYMHLSLRVQSSHT